MTDVRQSGGICNACKQQNHKQCIDVGIMDRFERWVADELAAKEHGWRAEGYTADLTEDLESVEVDLRRQTPYRSCNCHHKVRTKPAPAPMFHGYMSL